MSPFAEPPAHALNNLLGKIMGSAELALDRVTDPSARAELESILALAASAADQVRGLTLAATTLA
jgi:hypothetical protein